MGDEGLPRNGLFTLVRTLVRARRAAHVRVVCDPPDGPAVGLDFLSGCLVGVQCEGLGPVDALEVLASARAVRYTCAPSQPLQRHSLLLEDSFHAWMATRGAFVPSVIPERPEGDWSVRGLVELAVSS